VPIEELILPTQRCACKIRCKCKITYLTEKEAFPEGVVEDITHVN
jgi:hypothetical protein